MELARWSPEKGRTTRKPPRRALDATSKCLWLEQATKQDMQRCQQLAKQVDEAEVQCLALTQQLEAARASDSDKHSASRHTLSSPDLGKESDAGRGGGDERSRLNQEKWQLKQKLAERQRIMKRCLEALNKNRDWLRVQASMEKQLLRTEEVLLKASHNHLKLVPKMP
ncbi:Hypothetical predicted protein [Cloeon dipterum]|uniref:Uncharacterized protein n=1 Tax=Cloeon dipterum TaxID=197152 RepID=A0A8S1DUF2_9INSE|nr:Hypothetical predicted protein [Cloeon dipterum]